MKFVLAATDSLLRPFGAHQGLCGTILILPSELTSS